MANETFRRYTLLFISLFINAFGVVFITKAALGTSPISSVPYILSLSTPFSFGFFTLIVNSLIVLGEVALLGAEQVRRKKFELLAQLPVIAIFSSSIDVSMALLHDFAPTTYAQMMCSLIGGCLILAIGIGWAVKASVAMNPGEYIVNIICRKVGKPFGNVKLCFDAVLVACAILLSLAFLHTIIGLREGTIAAALFVGPMERLLYPAWRIFDRWLQPLQAR